jgi:hypothetical protein
VPYKLKYPIKSRKLAEFYIKKKKYPWLKRAVNPKSATTPKNEAIRTATGGGMLFPTIRQTPLGGLKKFKVGIAQRLAKRSGQYIDVSNMKKDEATDLSKAISNIIGERRGSK